MLMAIINPKTVLIVIIGVILTANCIIDIKVTQLLVMINDHIIMAIIVQMLDGTVVDMEDKMGIIEIIELSEQ